jgi:pimeloyl-ACP methyl ester carboxylesterase
VSLNASFEVTKTDSAIIEHGYFYSEQNEKVPTLICKPVTGNKPFPVVIFLHGTGGSKEDGSVKRMLFKLCKKGIMAVSIDARFHGERITGGAHGSKEYVGAITQAWENKDQTHQTHPFYYDTAYDLWRLTDYLITRPDVDPKRIGMTGISMGGIETWLAASVDKRIKVAVLDIAVQSFKWSLDNGRWQGRVGTIEDAHKQAARDMGDSTINTRNIQSLWNKVVPGITGEFDCPSMLRLFAPRPLLILNTEKDLNNPLPGAIIAYDSAKAAYVAKSASDKLSMFVQPSLGHTASPLEMQMLVDWFVKWL